VEWNATSTFFLAGRYDEAIAQAKAQIEIDPHVAVAPERAAGLLVNRRVSRRDSRSLRQAFLAAGVPAQNRAMWTALIADYRKGGVAGSGVTCSGLGWA